MKCLCVFAVLVMYTTAHLVSDVPLFAWSGKAGSFGGINKGISSSLTAADVESLLTSIVHGENIPNAFSDKAHTIKPEVLIVYLESELRLDQVNAFATKLTALQNSMHDSASSLYAPYVDLPYSLSEVIATVSNSVQKKAASVIYAGKGVSFLPQLKQVTPTLTAVSIAKLKTLLSGSKLFTNGVTDLIIVHLDAEKNVFDKFERTNEVISSVNSLVSENTQDYVAVYTGLSYENAEWVESFDSVKRYLEFSEMVFLDDNNVTNGTQPTVFQEYFPGWFWEVFFSFIFLLPIILSGYCMLMSVQAPEHFIPPSKDKFKKRS